MLSEQKVGRKGDREKREYLPVSTMKKQNSQKPQPMLAGVGAESWQTYQGFLTNQHILIHSIDGR